MKSIILHKLLTIPLLFVWSVWSYPLSNQTQPLQQQPLQQQQQQQQQHQQQQQSVVFIQTNVNIEDAKNYQITIPKDAKPDEPCLTISWKTNPDGSGPDAPQIYWANGYLRIMPPTSPYLHQ